VQKTRGEDDLQKRQVMLQEQAGKPFWRHDSSRRMDDGHPDLDDRFLRIQREFWSDSEGIAWVT
jgi:hypothetical protein